MTSFTLTPFCVLTLFPYIGQAADPLMGARIWPRKAILSGRQDAAMVRMVFLQKRDPEQAFWGWAEIASPQALPFMPVRGLATVDRVKVSEPYARRVLAYLRHELQMAEEDTPNIRCPVEMLDEDGQPLALA
jgi:hypothetical protein